MSLATAYFPIEFAYLFECISVRTRVGAIHFRIGVIQNFNI